MLILYYNNSNEKRECMNTITFGIIGTGQITHRFIRGVNKVKEAKVVAIASRSLDKAEIYCAKYPWLTPYGSYDDILKNPSIQAVYIALPNYLHAEMIKKALDAGKHVLCEKPMVLHKEEVHECFAIAKERGTILMEAMKLCFLPTTLKAKQWIKEGKIGRVRYLEASYCVNHPAPFESGWHSHMEQGGGALYDLGVYPLAFANAICEADITSVQGIARKSTTGIDMLHMIQLQYADGACAQLRCAVDVDTQNQANIYGDSGRIMIPNFWKSDTAIVENTQGKEIFYEDHDASEFQYQIHSFTQAILGKEKEVKLMSESKSARNAGVIDQLIRKEGCYES